MRIAFLGAGEIPVLAARALIAQGHEVVFIEKERERIEDLSESLDCGFLHGDGSKPAILRELGPKETDLLFCLSDSDQANVIASLVAKSLGFRRVVTSIENPDLELICEELGLEDTIIPARTISRQLEDMVRGLDSVELSTVLKDAARLFTFVVEDGGGGSVSELGLPSRARVMCYYREEAFQFADPSTTLEPGDEVVILAHRDALPELNARWNPNQVQES